MSELATKVQEISNRHRENTRMVAAMNDPFKGIEFVEIHVPPNGGKVKYDFTTPRTVYIRPLLPIATPVIDGHVDQNSGRFVVWNEFLVNDQGNYIDQSGREVPKAQRVQKLVPFQDPVTNLISHKASVFEIQFDGGLKNEIELMLPRDRYILEDYVVNSSLCRNNNVSVEPSQHKLFWIDDPILETKMSEKRIETQEKVGIFIKEVQDAGLQNILLDWLQVPYSSTMSEKLVKAKLTTLENDKHKRILALLESPNKEDAIRKFVFTLAENAGVIGHDSSGMYVLHTESGAQFSLSIDKDASISALFSNSEAVNDVYRQTGSGRMADFLAEYLKAKSLSISRNDNKPKVSQTGEPMVSLSEVERLIEQAIASRIGSTKSSLTEKKRPGRPKSTDKAPRAKREKTEEPTIVSELSN